MTDAADMLMMTLQLAVPLRIDEANRMTPAQRAGVLRAWAANAGAVVACRGDQLMFATRPYKGEGGTADTFNHLARGLAALAFAPGGVQFRGVQWCALHAPGGARMVDEILCERCCLYERLARAMRRRAGLPAAPCPEPRRRHRAVEVVDLLAQLAGVT